MMQSPSSSSDDNDIRYALVRKHPDGSLSFKTSLSTYLGKWNHQLVLAKIDADPSQLKAALTKEKKRISKERASLSIGNHHYYSDAYIQDLQIPYTYYLLPIKLSYEFTTATQIP